MPINYRNLRRKYPDIMTRRAVARKLRRKVPKKVHSEGTKTQKVQVLTEQEEISKTYFGRPHCFLLGAGASLAAFPNGDKNGRKLPVMKNFVEVLGLEPYLKKAGFEPPYDDFEAIYAKLAEDEKNRELVEDLENVIYNYFEGMELPDEPTIYDHLILSLREKDVIATFNWDPFLFQAAARNSHIKKPPKLFFLHGSVAVGICNDCRLKINAGALCPKCHHPVERSNILYPVTQKNYTADPFISNEWEAFKHYLKQGYIFTIFGYGAPVSDVEAVDLLKTAWGSPDEKVLEEIEIIDLLSSDELAERWSDFIHTHHYRTVDSFYSSMTPLHPRRTCEALWECLMMLKPSYGADFPKDAGFEELYEFIKPRLDAEKA